MKIKNISVGIAGIFLFVVAGLPQTALADKTVKMDLRFAGAFISNSLPSPLIHVQAKGKPGKAVIRGYGANPALDAVEAPVLECLGSPGVFARITAAEDPLIFTFNDLSLLFADGSGEICLDLATFDSVFRFDITFTGGRGKYEGATGTAVITGEAHPVSVDGSFLAETGTIVGTIIVPKKKKSDS
jgi:hypothetical protein